jgi:N utilization substance protein B
LVLESLYAVECGAEEPDDKFIAIIDDEELPEATIKYARELLAVVRKNLVWADEQIVALAVNWEIDRIATIDKFILRMAMTELKFMVDVPVKVVLNEAIELAKKFSTPQSSSFVNGILDSFAKQLDQEDQPAE